MLFDFMNKFLKKKKKYLRVLKKVLPILFKLRQKKKKNKKQRPDIFFPKALPIHGYEI